MTRDIYGPIIILKTKCSYHNHCVWKNVVIYHQEYKLIFITEIIIKEKLEKESNINNLKYIDIEKVNNNEYIKEI